MQDNIESEFRHPPRKKRGRPSKASAGQEPGTSGMETSNSYDSLTDESIEFHIAKESLKRKKPRTVNISKEPKLPPITIFNIPITQVKSELVLLGIQGHEIKVTQYGIKIFANTHEHFKLIKSHYTINKNEFYTHTLKEEQTTKYIVHGLHDIDVSEISKELATKELNPCDIKKISIKKPHQDEQLMYIIYFKKSQSIKISDVRNVRTLSYIRIRWEYYRNKKIGPTQCNNCMKYGHGALNCHLKPRCVRCGLEHTSKTCPLMVDNNNNKIPEAQLKCANCDGNHSAKNVHCPKREEYIKVIKNIRNNNKRTTSNPTTPTKYFQNAPQLSSAHFPSINSRASKPWSNENPQVNITKAFDNKSSENELFSTQELLIIVKEMMTKLSSCRTKSDQFHAIAELACTHLYGK